MIIFKERHFPKELILMAVRWNLAYPLSYRNIEELMEERGADVDHSTIQKWVVYYAPQTRNILAIIWNLLIRMALKERLYLFCKT